MKTIQHFCLEFALAEYTQVADEAAQCIPTQDIQKMSKSGPKLLLRYREPNQGHTWQNNNNSNNKPKLSPTHDDDESRRKTSSATHSTVNVRIKSGRPRALRSLSYAPYQHHHFHVGWHSFASSGISCTIDKSAQLRERRHRN